MKPPIAAPSRRRPAIIRWWRALTLLAAAWLLAGCSVVSLGYNRLPLITYWWLDGQFDFNGAQAERVRAELEQLHRWHRSTQLPRYAALLRDWQALARQELSADQACEQYERALDLLDDWAEQALPALSRLAPLIEPAQLRHLQRQQAKDNETWLAEHDGSAKAAAAELDRALDRAEMLYGRLGPAQRESLRQRLASDDGDRSRYYAERQRRQSDVLETLRQIRAGADPDAAVRAAWKRFKDSPTPGYGAYRRERERLACQQFADLHNASTAEQRQHAVRKLRDLERDFLGLAAP